MMNKKVLVLNQDYSPIGVCHVQKAFILVFLDKADIIEQFESLKLRTIEKSFPYPAVIKLSNYKNIPYKGVMLNRFNLFKRDGFSCQYCSSRKDLTLDHVIPKSKGGKTTWENLVTACRRCNARKGHQTPEQVGLKLAQQPYKPTYADFLKEYALQNAIEWLPYLKARTLV
ncbi:HNH endonuclease [Penaeicola halotolerans]|uniref:HNH endonuclease n=1 Tax=Penaeicola halotolerans TaxID=2793196 RepID=UPI00293D6364|nr:HNH endonuclease [Penaeicola halotolerans]